MRRPGAGFVRLDRSVTRRRVAHQRIEQLVGDVRHLLDRAVEGELVRLRRPCETTQLSDELKGRGANFFLVAGGSKLCRVLMFRHMNHPQTTAWDWRRSPRHSRCWHASRTTTQCRYRCEEEPRSWRRFPKSTSIFCSRRRRSPACHRDARRVATGDAGLVRLQGRARSGEYRKGKGQGAQHDQGSAGGARDRRSRQSVPLPPGSGSVRHVTEEGAVPHIDQLARKYLGEDKYTVVSPARYACCARSSRSPPPGWAEWNEQPHRRDRRHGGEQEECNVRGPDKPVSEPC